LKQDLIWIQATQVKTMSAFAEDRPTRVWGHVRASPLTSALSGSDKKKAEQWHKWREQNLSPLQYPVEGFDHIHGQNIIQQVDETPLGGSSSLDRHQKEQEENQEYLLHDYGSTKTPDDAPVGSLRDKWRLLPYFLRLRSLLRQHIDSYNYFINTELQQIISSPSNNIIRSDHDPKFYLKYEQIYVDASPSVDEDSYILNRNITPMQCRLRDCTYSAPIYVNVRYTRGHDIVRMKHVMIGRMPIMLRSEKCCLSGKSEHALATQMKECPYDPGGYFIIKGVEKVVLIQEQLSKNRVIVEHDEKNQVVTASITSSTHERKSKAYIFLNKNGRVYLKNNSLGEDVPVIVALKAMGVESDVQLVQLITSGGSVSRSTEGSEEDDDETESLLLHALALSLEESHRLQVHTQFQALKYIGSKLRGGARQSSHMAGSADGGGEATAAGGGAPGGGSGARSRAGGAGGIPPLSPEEEARELLANVVFSHVPVTNFDFRYKAVFVGHVVRRVLLVSLGKMSVDDKDYYGNKRLELAGNLLSLLFEDLFKIFNKDLKRQADLVLSKPNRAQAFDVIRTIRTDTITNGMINAIATGNWVLKRFRMDRAGVTQVLSRLSYMSALGMMVCSENES
jgi:DNA-directed RNA polymerase III subunit RPC2